MSTIIGNCIYGVLWVLGQVGKRLPYSIQLAMGAIFGFLFCVCAPGRCGVAWQNIKLVFPAKTRKERWRIFLKSMLHLGLCIWEWICLPAMTPADIQKKMRLENEPLAELIAKHGGLILTAHMGNWEYMAAYTSSKWVPLAIVYRYFRQRWAEVLWQKVRRQHSVDMIPESQSAFQIIRRLNQKCAIGIMCDQHMGVPEGVVIPFFGHDVGAMPALAVLQIRTHQYVFPVFCYREWKTGKFVVVVDGKINPEQRRLEEYQLQIHEYVARYQAYIEKWIKQYPDQWLWVHRRFKYSYDYAKKRKKLIPKSA